MQIDSQLIFLIIRNNRRENEPKRYLCKTENRFAICRIYDYFFRSILRHIFQTFQGIIEGNESGLALRGYCTDSYDGILRNVHNRHSLPQ